MAQPAQPDLPASGSHVAVEPWQMLVRQTASINAGRALQYNFSLTGGTKLLAQFQVQGGLNNKIQVYLLDLPNYQLFASRRPFKFLPGASGEVRGLGQYAFRVPQDGVYYIVLDNAKAWLMPRSVTLHVDAILPDKTAQSEQLQKILEQQYGMLKKVFVFPEFKTTVRHCGTVNAFSNPDITLCVELVEELQAKQMGMAVEFVYFHELGHSLMKQWGLPLWDNEDAADEFATAFFLMAKKQDIPLQAAQSFASEGANTQDAVAKIWMDDRHSLSPQRARNIIRWVNNREELVPRWERVFIPNMQTPVLQSMMHDPQFALKDFVQAELTRRGATAQGN
jgi:hypothetical protein